MNSRTDDAVFGPIMLILAMFAVLMVGWGLWSADLVLIGAAFVPCWALYVLAKMSKSRRGNNAPPSGD